ncbi:thiamine-phosphate kinase [Candidatus Contubernalis alkaliaceticus]|uniref:thiamine-phosphate kinase n=1 Tax=Candidatus Contubernalis alkaliaceticus TaxID=338645 RepID=UPI001F4BEAAA|nr:thiamine-phosphate kinase [Candidatus Contubernalis alkalaceticus]UNC91443.1 thiamine-phosphate kinase [Candidatus Contubernalis alkalaceticus]
MLISEIGEVQLIKGLTRDIFPDPEVVVTGIGDDAAAVKTAEDKLQLFTKDVLVEGIHFLRETISPWQLGRKSLAVNISDIAAMGGAPRHLLIAVALPSNTEVEWIEEFYRGMKDLCRICSINLIGGDTVRSPQGITISITLIGEVERERMLVRSGAREGDLVAVTGFLGASAAGLELLLQGLPSQNEWEKEVLKAHQEPPLRIKESRILSASGVVTSMIDLSDGLYKDLGEICSASGVGARIFASSLPISDATGRVCRHLTLDPVSLAVSGGEDYELLFTFSEENLARMKDLSGELEGKIIVIGKIVSKEEGLKIVDFQGEETKLTRKGFDHF